MGRRARHEGSVYKRADGRWVGALVVNYKEDGRPLKRSVYGKTQKQALSKLQTLQQKLSEEGETPSGIATVEQLVRSYLGQLGVDKDVSTIAKHETRATQISGYIGDITLAEINGERLAKFFDTMKRDGVSGNIRARTHGILKKAFEYAVYEGLIPRSPLQQIACPPASPLKKERDAWTAVEVEKFVGSAAEQDRLFPAIYLILSNGLRPGEALGLKWTDVRGNQLHIQRTVRYFRRKLIEKPPKGRKTRTVGLSADVLERLKIHKLAMDEEFSTKGIDADDWIFPNRVGKVLHHTSFRRTLYRLADLAGVRRIRPHGLRRTWVSLGKRAGRNAAVMSKEAGHSVSVSDGSYTIVDSDWEAEESMSLLDVIKMQAKQSRWVSSTLTHVQTLLTDFDAAIAASGPDLPDPGLIENLLVTIELLASQRISKSVS